MGAIPEPGRLEPDNILMLDQILDGYLEADTTGIITSVNLPFIDALGLRERSEVTGKLFWELTRKQYARGIMLTYRSVIESGVPSEYIRIICEGKNGHSFIGEAAISPMFENGKVCGTRSLIRDVTHRFEAERERDSEKDFLEALLQQSPIAIATVDKNKKISRINPAFQRLFRCTPEEATGQKIEHFFSAPDLYDKLDEFTGSHQSEPLYISGQQNKTDGSVTDLEIYIQPFFAGSINYGHLVFCNDISGIRKAEEELVNATTAYRRVLDTLQDAYFEADARGFITYVNQPLVEATRYGSKNELIGLHFRHLVDHSARLQFLREFKNLFETSQPVRRLQIPYLTKDGTRFSSEVVASPIIEDGKIRGTRGIIRDVSARVKAEQLLKTAKEAAESRAGELTALNRMAQKISRSLDFQDILEISCRELTRVFPIQIASVALLKKKNGKLAIKASYRAGAVKKRSADRPPPGSISSTDDDPYLVDPGDYEAIQKVLRDKEIQIIQSDEMDAFPKVVQEMFGGSDQGVLMLIPLITRSEVFGFIGMRHSDPGTRFHPDQVELAETVASQIASALENARLYAQTERALDMAERDLEIGREIQSGFFPHTIPSLPGWEIATFFQAAKQVSGDFYDVYPIGESGQVGLVVADVCDKGVGAALFMVLLRSLIRSTSEQYGNLDAPENLLQTIMSVNRYVVNHHGRSNMFATLFMGILAPEDGSFHYINAGHEPALHIGPSGGIRKELMPSGPAIGFSAEIPFEVGHTKMSPGEIILSFTDGFSEARDMQCRMYSGERFIREAGKPWPSAFSAVKQLEWDVFSHMGGQVQLDDLTLVGLRRRIADEIPTHQLTCPADMANLIHFRSFVGEACRMFGMVDEITESLKMATDELCSNVILYGYRDKSPGKITLMIRSFHDELRIVIEDTGRPFDPHDADAPDLGIDLDNRAVGGLGIYLVKELADEVKYERKEGRNQVTLIKKRIRVQTREEMDC